MDIEQARAVHARVLGADPPVDPRGAPIIVELKVFDESTRKSIRDLVIVGSALGFAKDEYVGYPQTSNGVYSEHDRSARRINGPRVASKATLIEGESPPRYRVETPGGFQLSPGFNTLTKSYSWEGVVLSKDYCTKSSYVSLPNDAHRAMHEIAAVRANRANDINNNAVYLRQLANDTPLRIRHHLMNSTASLVGHGMMEGDPRAALFDEVLGWAAPASTLPFEHMAYVSYLIRYESDLTRNLGDQRNKTELQVLRKRMDRHLPAARLSYYEFDDWQVVPETEKIEWNQDLVAGSPATQSCDRLDTSGRIGPSRWWNTAEGAREEAPLRTGLKPFPFCFRDQSSKLLEDLEQQCARGTTAWKTWSVEAYRPRYAQSHSSDLAPGRTALAVRANALPLSSPSERVGVSPVPPTSCQEPARFRHAMIRGNPRFLVQCRHADVTKCNLNALNPFGDTALMTLARVDTHGIDRYSFSRVPSERNTGSGTFAERRYTREAAVRMTEALLASGAGVSPLHPVLDVNALEVAIDPFFRGSIRSSDSSAWIAQSDMVELLLAAFEKNTNATLRADYLKAVGNLAGSDVRPLSYGEKPWPKLDPALVARLQKLPSRPEKLMCGEHANYPFGGWMQYPPLRLGSNTVSPIDLR